MNAAIQTALKERPVKSNRGRKAVDEDQYIKESTEKIAVYEKELKEKKNKISATEYEKIYNKKTALQSRLRKKLEKRKTE